MIRRRRTLAAAVLASLLVQGCSQGENAPPEHTSEDPSEDTSWQAQLEALGYISSVPVKGDGESTGVTIFDEDAAFPGLNLFNSRNESVAKLMTLDGRVVHRWQSDVRGTTVARFERFLPSQPAEYFDGWNHIELLPDGDLLVIGSHHMLLRLDWDSNVVWKLDLSAHHDLAVAGNGDIHVLTDAVRTAQVGGKTIAFQDNEVVTVSPGGEIRGRFSLYDAFRGRRVVQQKLAWVGRQQIDTLASWGWAGAANPEYQKLYASATRGDFAEHEDVKNLLFHGRPEDIFHANSIQLLAEEPPLWRTGDLLISILMLNMIVVIDRETERVKWTWGPGELERPHHASQLPDGGILVFDNGVVRGSSRVVKLDPRTREIVWSYRGSPPSSFFSKARGGAQLLANGNVLIAETDNGRAFEVTPDGEVVWEFYNDVWRDDAGDEKRGAIYRMTRVDAPDSFGANRPLGAD